MITGFQITLIKNPGQFQWLFDFKICKTFVIERNSGILISAANLSPGR